ncbi:int-tm_transporter_33 [Biomphalaria pfeifferi]|uniref:Int-tm_transporter_33 n=1 Tax=Biomphalaria pfeifferi TaxID=112525 RepID=A0AAD8FG72_BIOPF|nr:int-tm_transporter_33 [Biomphalaria pfeifferi]
MAVTRKKVSCVIFDAPSEMPYNQLRTYADVMKFYNLTKQRLKYELNNKDPPHHNVAEIVITKVEQIWDKASIPHCQPPTIEQTQDHTKRKYLSLEQTQGPYQEEISQSRTDSGPYQEEISRSRTDSGPYQEEISQSRTDSGPYQEEISQSRTDSGPYQEKISQSRTDLGPYQEEISQSRTDSGPYHVIDMVYPTGPQQESPVLFFKMSE